MSYTVSIHDFADDREWSPIASRVNKILAFQHVNELIGQGWDTEVSIRITDDNAQPGYDEVEWDTMRMDLCREALDSGWDVSQLELPTRPRAAIQRPGREESHPLFDRES